MKTAEIWITNGILVTQDDKRRVLRANLRIIDGRIAEITKRTPKKSAKLKIIDARGATILPGFVQCHIHLCQTLFRNQADDLELLDWLSKKIWPMESAHTGETLSTSALLGIHELLSSGTTCILDMGTVRHTDAIYDAVKTSGIRASVGKCLMDHPLRNPKNLQEPTRRALDEAQTLFSEWNGRENDRIRVSYAPRFAISCTEELMKEVAALSKEQNAIIHTHANENRKEIEFVRKISGCSNIEYLRRMGMTSDRLVLAHGVWLDSHEVQTLKKSKTRIVHCPSSNLKLASGIAKVTELRKKGILVALGADGASCNNNLNAFQEMRLAALLQKPIHGPRAMPAQEVLDMATRDGAKALHWFDDIGSIEIGKKADLIALDLSSPENSVPAHCLKTLDSNAFASSIVYATGAQHVRMTMVDGKVLFENGRVTSIGSKSLMDRVHRARHKINQALQY